MKISDHLINKHNIKNWSFNTDKSTGLLIGELNSHMVSFFFFNLDYCSELNIVTYDTFETYAIDYKSLKSIFFLNMSKGELFFQTHILQSNVHWLFKNVALVQDNLLSG